MSNNPWVNGVGSPAGTYFAGGTDVAVTDGGTGSSTAVAAAQALSVPYVLAQWGVPVIAASSGSMGNNGAVTALTGLDRTYSSGAWLVLPAGAIAAGVPAATAIYWFVGSSTTAGTVFNSTLAGTGIPTAGVTTAFSTTGPGLFTGITTEVVVATVTVPVLAANSSIWTDALWGNTNNANGKTPRIRLGASGAGTGGTALYAGSGGAQFNYLTAHVFRNMNSTSAQLNVNSTLLAGIGSSGSNNTAAAIDTSLGTAQLVFTLQKSTATDNLVLEGATIVARF